MRPDPSIPTLNERGPASLDPRLHGLVRRIWSVRADRQPGSRERILYNGAVELIFDLSANAQRARIGEGPSLTLPRCVFNGLKLQPLDLDFSGAQHFVGVQLEASACQRLFALPASTLVNRVLGGEELGFGLHRLHERLAEAPGFAHQAALLEGWLLRRVTRPRHEPRAAPAYLLAAQARRPEAPTREAARQLGLSERHLRRLWLDWQGLGPEAWLRTRRFTLALQLMDAQAPKLADLAQQAGYSDQAHFNREFRRHAGLSPGEYLRRRQGPVGHLRL